LHGVSRATAQVGKTTVRPVYGASTPPIEAVERYSKDDNTKPIHHIDEEDEDEDDLTTFIPLGWPKQLPQTYYRSSDPEWQSFLEFNGDPQRAAVLQRTD